MRKNILMRLVLVFCASILIAVTVYFANFLLMPKNLRWSLSQKELLFIEGLLFFVIGIFFLISGSPDTKPRGELSKQRLLYGGGPPTPNLREKLTLSASLIALTLILIGAILIFLALLP